MNKRVGCMGVLVGLIVISMVILAIESFGGSKASETDYSVNISEIKLAEIENDIAFYDVYLTEDTDWNNMDDDEKFYLSKQVIAKCQESFENENAEHLWVQGYVNSKIAFSWTEEKGYIVYFENSIICNELDFETGKKHY